MFSSPRASWSVSVTSLPESPVTRGGSPNVQAALPAPLQRGLGCMKEREVEI